MHHLRLWNQLSDSFRQPNQPCLDSPPHSLINPSLFLVIIAILSIHHFFTLSLEAQNLPFQHILPTLTFLLCTAFMIMGLDRTGLIMLISLFFVFILHFLFVSCGRLYKLAIRQLFTAH